MAHQDEPSLTLMPYTTETAPSEPLPTSAAQEAEGGPSARHPVTWEKRVELLAQTHQ